MIIHGFGIYRHAYTHVDKIRVTTKWKIMCAENSNTISEGSISEFYIYHNEHAPDENMIIKYNFVAANKHDPIPV